jgi:serine/threonine protein kinase/tetratricopeptide (TPR) repeat protein
MSQALSANSIISNYRIVSRLGAGGMGEVYLAEDSRLRRQVALKVLPRTIALDTDRLARFEREAHAASALNHPNILTIHEFGASGETHFIASEFVQGETLRERFSRGHLTANEILDITIQIASALQAAHGAGIIHRDIKPENVMIRDDGYVKVLDFGLAKLSEPRSMPTGSDSDPEAQTKRQVQTQAGIIMGTVAYMSPEQARGNAVDPRTDLFSLGVVLYELLTRKQPFTGETINHTIVNIIEKEPPPLSLTGAFPVEFEKIIAKCLAKKVDQRYQTAKDLIVDLKKMQTQLLFQSEVKKRSSFDAESETATQIIDTSPGASGEIRTSIPASAETPRATQTDNLAPATSKPNTKRTLLVIVSLSLVLLVSGFFAYRYFTANKQIESIAVMPFINDSGNADVEYLSDGMTETLISTLSQLPHLNVKARSTVFYYKGKEITPKKIGEELGVQAVLLGRVAQRGNDLKLSLELVNTTTQDVIWSEQYDRQQSELISLQGEIARDVSDKLRTKLSGDEVAKLTAVHTANPKAYELYLKGKYYSNQFTKAGLQIGVESFNQAVATDPNYSRAYSGLAYTYILLDDWFMSPHESVAKARENATKAIAIDETDVDAHLVMALVAHWYDWDWKKAEDEFKRAIALNPKNSESYVYYAYFLSSQERNDEALSIARQGLQIDPLSSLVNFGVASTLLFARRWDDAIAHLQNAIKIDPNYWFHRVYLGRAYEHKGMLSEATAEFQRGVDADREQSENWSGLAHAVAVSGKRADAEKILNDLLSKSAAGSYVSPYNIAVIYAGLADNEKALSWLERAYTERSYYLPVYLTTDERLDHLRAEPRFKDVIRKIGLPE